MESCTKASSTAQYARCITRWRLPITDTIQQWQNHLQVNIHIQCNEHPLLLSIFSSVHDCVYRFSRLLEVVDIGLDFNLNNSYFLIFGRRLMGKY